jgi:hypothetical protein
MAHAAVAVDETLLPGTQVANVEYEQANWGGAGVRLATSEDCQ